MAILENEVWIELRPKIVKHFEELNYHIPRRRDKWGKLTIPKGTKILVNVVDLPKGSHIKLTKVCDNENCEVVNGRHVKDQQYRAILLSRDSNNGKDLCTVCLYAKRADTRRSNVKYENSMEYFSKEYNMEYLLNEFSSNNSKLPNEISKFTHDKYLWNCYVCGEKDYEMSVANRTKLRQNCPNCAGNIKKTTHQYKQEIFNMVGDEYKITEEYINTRTPIKTKHEECSNEYYVSPNNFLRGRRCPFCSESKGEIIINQWLKRQGVIFETQKEFNGLIGLKGGNLSYDFYLPNQNILIEYQGEFHDGSTGEYSKINLESQKTHDERKRNYAKNHNIQLLEIWYWDFDNIENILEGFNVDKIK